jgi:hypothetical protein
VLADRPGNLVEAYPTIRTLLLRSIQARPAERHADL